jgi:hypothetical protein
MHQVLPVSWCICDMHYARSPRRPPRTEVSPASYAEYWPRCLMMHDAYHHPGSCASTAPERDIAQCAPPSESRGSTASINRHSSSSGQHLGSSRHHQRTWGAFLRQPAARCGSGSQSECISELACCGGRGRARGRRGRGNGSRCLVRSCRTDSEPGERAHPAMACV